MSSLAALFCAGGGLVFYLGPDVINATARIVMSCFIVISNTGFLVTTTFLFIREMIKELRDNGDGKFVPPQRSIIGGSSHSVSELSLEGGGGGTVSTHVTSMYGEPLDPIKKVFHILPDWVP